MYSEEDITESFSTMFEDWPEEEIPTQVDLNDNICTVRCKDIDEAYDLVCDMESPNFYALWRVNDGKTIWYKFRYQKD